MTSTELLRFLRGETTLCPTCLSPRESCTQEQPCCSHCPGWHLRSAKPRTRRLSTEV